MPCFMLLESFAQISVSNQAMQTHSACRDSGTRSISVMSSSDKPVTRRLHCRTVVTIFATFIIVVSSMRSNKC